MIFKRERAHDVIPEMLPLFEKHYKEIARYKDIPLDPDLDLYRKMEDSGVLRVFTARDAQGVLSGYAVYFIKHNPHYKSSLMAVQDILFIDPDKRGTGTKLILWCDAELQKEGVQVIAQHIKIATPYTIELFKRLGYEEVDVIMCKRLDKEI